MADSLEISPENEWPFQKYGISAEQDLSNRAPELYTRIKNSYSKDRYVIWPGKSITLEQFKNNDVGPENVYLLMWHPKDPVSKSRQETLQSRGNPEGDWKFIMALRVVTDSSDEFRSYNMQKMPRKLFSNFNLNEYKNILLDPTLTDEEAMKRIKIPCAKFQIRFSNGAVPNPFELKMKNVPVICQRFWDFFLKKNLKKKNEQLKKKVDESKSEKATSKKSSTKPETKKNNKKDAVSKESSKKKSKSSAAEEAKKQMYEKKEEKKEKSKEISSSEKDGAGDETKKQGQNAQGPEENESLSEAEKIDCKNNPEKSLENIEKNVKNDEIQSHAEHAAKPVTPQKDKESEDIIVYKAVDAKKMKDFFNSKKGSSEKKATTQSSNDAEKVSLTAEKSKKSRGDVQPKPKRRKKEKSNKKKSSSRHSEKTAKKSVATSLTHEKYSEKENEEVQAQAENELQCMADDDFHVDESQDIEMIGDSNHAMDGTEENMLEDLLDEEFDVNEAWREEDILDEAIHKSMRFYFRQPFATFININKLSVVPPLFDKDRAKVDWYKDDVQLVKQKAASVSKELARISHNCMNSVKLFKLIPKKPSSNTLAPAVTEESYLDHIPILFAENNPEELTKQCQTMKMMLKTLCIMQVKYSNKGKKRSQEDVEKINEFLKKSLRQQLTELSKINADFYKGKLSDIRAFDKALKECREMYGTSGNYDSFISQLKMFFNIFTSYMWPCVTALEESYMRNIHALQDRVSELEGENTDLQQKVEEQKKKMEEMQNAQIMNKNKKQVRVREKVSEPDSVTQGPKKRKVDEEENLAALFA